MKWTMRAWEDFLASMNGWVKLEDSFYYYSYSKEPVLNFLSINCVSLFVKKELSLKEKGFFFYKFIESGFESILENTQLYLVYVSLLQSVWFCTWKI